MDLNATTADLRYCGLDPNDLDLCRRVAARMMSTAHWLHRSHIEEPQISIRSVILDSRSVHISRNFDRTGVQPDGFVLDKDKAFILDFKYESVMTPKQRIRFGAYKYDQYRRMYGQNRVQK